jgi:hypothetical protein
MGAPFLDPRFTSNFTSVVRHATGIYCLTPAAGIDAWTTALAAVQDTRLSVGGKPGIVVVHTPGAHLGEHCLYPPGAAPFEVETFDLAGNPVDTIGFDVVVP